jgi:hypothetical protein
MNKTRGIDMYFRGIAKAAFGGMVVFGCTVQPPTDTSATTENKRTISTAKNTENILASDKKGAVERSDAKAEEANQRIAVEAPSVNKPISETLSLDIYSDRVEIVKKEAANIASFGAVEKPAVYETAADELTPNTSYSIRAGNQEIHVVTLAATPEIKEIRQEVPGTMVVVIDTKGNSEETDYKVEVIGDEKITVESHPEATSNPVIERNEETGFSEETAQLEDGNEEETEEKVATTQIAGEQENNILDLEESRGEGNLKEIRITNVPISYDNTSDEIAVQVQAKNSEGIETPWSELSSVADAEENLEYAQDEAVFADLEEQAVADELSQDVKNNAEDLKARIKYLREQIRDARQLLATEKEKKARQDIKEIIASSKAEIKILRLRLSEIKAVAKAERIALKKYKESKNAAQKAARMEQKEQEKAAKVAAKQKTKVERSEQKNKEKETKK